MLFEKRFVYQFNMSGGDAETYASAYARAYGGKTYKPKNTTKQNLGLKPIPEVPNGDDPLSKLIDRADGKSKDATDLNVAELFKRTREAKDNYKSLMELVKSGKLDKLDYRRKRKILELVQNNFRSRVAAVSAAEKRAKTLLITHAKTHKLNAPEEGVGALNPTTPDAGQYDLLAGLVDDRPTVATGAVGNDYLYRPKYPTKTTYSLRDSIQVLHAEKLAAEKEAKEIQKLARWYLKEFKAQQKSFKGIYPDFKKVNAPSEKTSDIFEVLAFVDKFHKSARAHVAEKRKELVGEDGKGGKYGDLNEKLDGVYEGYDFKVAELDPMPKMDADFSMKDAQIVKNRTDLLDERAKEEFAAIRKHLSEKIEKQSGEKSKLKELADKGHPEAVALFERVVDLAEIDLSSVTTIPEIVGKSDWVRAFFEFLKTVPTQVAKIGSDESMVAFYTKKLSMGEGQPLGIASVRDAKTALHYYNTVVDAHLRKHPILLGLMRSKLKSAASKFLAKQGQEYFLAAAKQAGEDITADPTAVQRHLRRALKAAFKDSFAGVDIDPKVLEGVMKDIDTKTFKDPKVASKYFADHFVIPEKRKGEGIEAKGKAKIFLGIDHLSYVYGNSVKRHHFSEDEKARLTENYKDNPIEFKHHALKAFQDAIKANNDKLQKFTGTDKKHLLPLEIDLVAEYDYERVKPAGGNTIVVEVPEKPEDVDAAEHREKLFISTYNDLKFKLAGLVGDGTLEGDLEKAKTNPDDLKRKELREFRRNVKARATSIIALAHEKADKGELIISYRLNGTNERWEKIKVLKTHPLDKVVGDIIAKADGKDFQIGLHVDGGDDKFKTAFADLGDDKAKLKYYRAYAKRLKVAARARAAAEHGEDIDVGAAPKPRRKVRRRYAPRSRATAKPGRGEGDKAPDKVRPGRKRRARPTVDANAPKAPVAPTRRRRAASVDKGVNKGVEDDNMKLIQTAAALVRFFDAPKDNRADGVEAIKTIAEAKQGESLMLPDSNEKITNIGKIGDVAQLEVQTEDPKKFETIAQLAHDEMPGKISLKTPDGIDLIDHRGMEGGNIA